jgi:2-iminobutanoate/2-iminopropanoate deaminase
MDRVVVVTSKAPAAIGPYSQAIEANGFLFVSGQLPIDPQTGEVESGGIASQTKVVLENMCAILKEAGLATSDVAKVTICLKDMNDFAAVNEVYGQFFAASPPARICYAVASLPKDVDIEIDCIAALNSL